MARAVLGLGSVFSETEDAVLKIATSLLCLLISAAVVLCRAQDGSLPPIQPGVQSGAPSKAGRAAEGGAPASRGFFQRMFSLEAVTSTLPGAALEQLHDWPDEWGRHASGFARRTASLYGQFVVGAAIEDAVKALHKEDTRYLRAASGNVFRRTAHVISGTVTARTPTGGRTIAWSAPANAYGSWAIATLWSPREYRTASSIVGWGSAGMGTMALGNFCREFWPDVKALFHHKP